MPQTPNNWNDKGQEIRAIVNEFSQTHAIDRDNIVIAGHSLGGSGTLKIASENSDHFFSRALILSASNTIEAVVNKVNIPVYGASGNGEGYTADLVKTIAKNNKNKGNDYEPYYRSVNTVHGSVPAYAFNIDENGNGCADLFELLFPDYT